MRPKKRILLIDKDEQRRSCTAFQLDVWGYRLAEPKGHADLVLAFTPTDEEMVSRLALERRCPSMMVWDGKGIVGTSFNRILTTPTAFAMHEAVKTLVIRKRGPVSRRHKAAREEFSAYVYSDVGNNFQAEGCSGV